MPSNRSNRSRSQSSQQRDRSSKKSSDSPEILHQLGRAVLDYSMERLSGKDKSDSRSTDHGRNTSRRSRSSTRGKDRDPERDNSGDPGTRSDSNDLHRIMGQVAVGLVGFGIRQYLHHRKQSKQKTAAAQPPRRRRQDPGARDVPSERPRGLRVGGSRPADPELAETLESLTVELEETARSIRKLTKKPPSHRNCEVYDRLRGEAERIQDSIANIQTSANNVKNLHGGLKRNI